MSVYAVAAAVTALVGAGISATSAYEQGQAQEDAGKVNAQNELNAADAEAKAGAENAERQREMNRRRIGAVRAQIGASGLQGGTGSSLDVLGESANELELQAQDAFQQSDNRQRQYLTQAGLDMFQGQSAATAGSLSAGGTLLSGFGNAYFGYQKVQSQKTS